MTAQYSPRKQIKNRKIHRSRVSAEAECCQIARQPQAVLWEEGLCQARSTEVTLLSLCVVVLSRLSKAMDRGGTPS